MVFSIGILPRLELETGTIGQQTSALTVRPSNAQLLELIYNCDILIIIELASSKLPKHNKRLNDVLIIGWNDRIKLLHKMI